MLRPTTIVQYIALFPKETQVKLKQMHVAIRAAAPDSVEGLKWGMPSYSHKRILVNFAGFKHHIGFYPTPSAITAFAKEIAKYKSARGSVQFPLDKPIPVALVKRMTKFRVKEESVGGKWKGGTC